MEASGVNVKIKIVQYKFKKIKTIRPPFRGVERFVTARVVDSEFLIVRSQPCWDRLIWI